MEFIINDQKVDLKVGSKVTVMYYTDREPATVLRMSKKGSKIVVRRNEAEHIGGEFENEWKIKEELVGEPMTFYHHKDGWWYTKNGGCWLNPFTHRKYFDYSF